MERRWGNRLVLNESVRVTRDREVLGLACLYEVSLSGALLQTPWTLPNMTRICLHMPQEWRTTRIDAFVVRQCENGIGIEWCEFAPRCLVQLISAQQRPVPHPAPRTHVPHTPGRRLP